MKRSILGFALWLGLIAPTFAQQPPPTAGANIGALQGSETLKSTCLNGSLCNILMNHVRNTQGYLAVPTGGTVTTNATWYNGAVIATGAITTWAVNLPNPAPDGMLFTVVNGTGSAFTTNTTVAAVAGMQTQTLNTTYASQTIAATSSVQFLFLLNSPTSSTGVWYRIR